MKCQKCNHEIPETTSGKILYRAVCEKCESYLHSCLNCRFHQVGRNNECLIPGTELIRDRAQFNFCDDFMPATGKKSEKSADDPGKITEKLFGNSIEFEKKKDPLDHFSSFFDE